jgi:paraquat-inducible protein B
MKKDKRYFLIGLFVLTGFVLFALGCILFGGSELFAEKVYFETYFDTSVQGLDVGGAVKFRGVPIGKVEQVHFATDVYYDDPEIQKAGHTREVFQSLMHIRVLCSINLEEHPSYSESRIKKMVERGMRASLGMQGITGIVFVNLDYYGESHENCKVKFLWEPKEIYVPSCPTTLQNLVDVVQDIGEELRKVNFSETIQTINRLADNVNVAVVSADLPRLSATFTQLGESLSTQAQALEKVLNALDAEAFGDNLKALSGNLAETSATLREAMPQLTQHTDETLATVRDALTQLKTTLATVNASFEEVRRGMDFEAFGDETHETLNALSRTAASLEALVEELREKPSRLIFDTPVE